jgi:hypothetical protein
MSADDDIQIDSFFDELTSDISNDNDVNFPEVNHSQLDLPMPGHTRYFSSFLMPWETFITSHPPGSSTGAGLLGGGPCGLSPCPQTTDTAESASECSSACGGE